MFVSKQEIVNFYSTIVECKNKDKCPNTINDLESGNPPRGFYVNGYPADISILLVGKNPGHALESEIEIYKNQSAEQIAATHLGFVHNIFISLYLNPSDNRSLTFHKNILRYMSFFLDLPKDKIFEKCAYTNLVKCSTKGESNRLNLKTMIECFQRNFIREINFYNPKIIIAFGKEVYNFLIRDDIKNYHKRPVVYLKHPSYYYSKVHETQILESKKQEILSYSKEKGARVIF